MRCMPVCGFAMMILLLTGPAVAWGGLMDSFDYAPTGDADDLDGQNGGTGAWGSAWTSLTGSGSDVTAGSLDYPGLTESGNKASIADGNRIRRTFDNTYGDDENGQSVYLSVLWQADGNVGPVGIPYMSVELLNGGDNADDVGVAGGDRVFGLGVQRNVTNGGADFDARALDAAGESEANDFAAFSTDVHLWVVRFDFAAGDDNIEIFFDPTGATNLAGSGDQTISDVDISFDRIALANFVADQSLQIDEIRLDSTAPTVPEPHSLGMLALSGLGLFVAARRRRK